MHCSAISSDPCVAVVADLCFKLARSDSRKGTVFDFGHEFEATQKTHL
jgi:hypothetical protein